MTKGWQGPQICANPATLTLKTPRNLILCGQVKGQVVEGEVRYARNVSVTYFAGLFNLLGRVWTFQKFGHQGGDGRAFAPSQGDVGKKRMAF